MESIKSTLNGAKDGWTKLDKKKKFSMLAFIAGITLIVTLLTYNNNKVEYDVLFTNLELQDAGYIVNDLETKKIKYRLENNGRNIMIDKDLVDNYRIQLAMDGMMPESSTGFEIFDDTGMMVTDEDRQIMYQRALTGELQRSIMSLEAINSAKVHLVMPEKSIFDTEDKSASASVIIDIKPYQKVTQDMIRGIVALISGAVDNMPKENIQVIDSKGNLLSGFLNQDYSMSTLDVMSQYQKVTRQFEEELESNLLKILGSALGRDKIRVSVLADLDFDSEETTMITYSNPVQRSEQIQASGGNMDIQQVTGGSIDDNISNVTDTVEGDNSTYSRITNNELSSETKSIIKAPGKVNKITTSVVYDGNISDQNLLKIQSLVAATTGYDSERGDIISIEGIKFESPDLASQDGLDTNASEAEDALGPYGKYIRLGLRILGVVLLVVIAVLTARNIRKKKREDKLFQEQLVASTINTSLPVIEDVGLKVEPDTKGDKAKTYAKEHPDLAADLIKAWMKDQ
jgi:flagellar M-ring protein FliF